MVEEKVGDCGGGSTWKGTLFRGGGGIWRGRVERVEEAVGGSVAVVAVEYQRHGLVVELCTTIGDSVVSTAT